VALRHPGNPRQFFHSEGARNRLGEKRFQAFLPGFRARMAKDDPLQDPQKPGSATQFRLALNVTVVNDSPVGGRKIPGDATTGGNCNISDAPCYYLSQQRNWAGIGQTLLACGRMVRLRANWKCTLRLGKSNFAVENIFHNWKREMRQRKCQLPLGTDIVSPEK
jgi:hypothetical protein